MTKKYICNLCMDKHTVFGCVNMQIKCPGCSAINSNKQDIVDSVVIPVLEKKHGFKDQFYATPLNANEVVKKRGRPSNKTRIINNKEFVATLICKN